MSGTIVNPTKKPNSVLMIALLVILPANPRRAQNLRAAVTQGEGTITTVEAVSPRLVA